MKASKATVIFAPMQKYFLTLFITLALLNLGVSQKYENIKIGESPVMRRGLCEPTISINRLKPDTVLAGAILDRVFYSFDGGKTWGEDSLQSSFGVWGDPVIISDYQGSQYYLHLSDPTGENWQSEEILDRIVCQRTDDGGITWSDGSYMGLNHPKDQDKHWAVVDPSTGNIYCTWTQFDDYGSKDSADRSNILFAYSTDRGESWSEAMAINELSGDCVDGDNTTEGAVPAVGPNGEVYVAWSNREKIFFDRLDSVNTHLEQDIVVADQPGGWDIDVKGLMRCNGMPVTVCDLSDGPNRGTVYVNWVDDRSGNYDVWVASSEDRGETWSDPVKINDDRSKRDQFFTWMSCDPATGYLYTIFYDRRNNKGTETEVYLAWSKDGGKKWHNELLSEKAFYTNPLIFFGDYNNIDAYHGRVRPVWTQLASDGTMSIWTALIDF